MLVQKGKPSLNLKLQIQQPVRTSKANTTNLITLEPEFSKIMRKKKKTTLLNKENTTYTHNANENE